MSPAVTVAEIMVTTSTNIFRLPILSRRRLSFEPPVGSLPLQRETIASPDSSHEAGAKTADVCRKHGVSSATFYKWKAKCGGLDVSDAKRLRSLEDENAKLKKLLAEAMLDSAMLKDIAAKKMVTPAAKREAVAHPSCRYGRGVAHDKAETR
jgi:transposase-like protein